MDGGDFWWGDMSCNAMGGNGQTNGTLVLSTSTNPNVPYTMDALSNPANTGSASCTDDFLNGKVTLLQ